VESYPRVVLEAMHHELPLIASPVFGVREQTGEGRGAIFYEPGRWDDLALAFSQLLRNPEERRSRGRQARSALGSLPTYQAMIRRYAKLFPGSPRGETTVSCAEVKEPVHG